MTDLLEGLRSRWAALNDRERRLLGMLGAVAAAFMLAFPLFLTARQNTDLEERNGELRRVLALISEQRPRLQQLADARKTAAARYQHKTPPLGSFLETEAGKHGLTIREVTDQPEKSSGNYHRRSATASIHDVDLTGVINMLSGIVSSNYPVAIEHVQIEHYQPGDKYVFKLGVLTFDRKTAAETSNESAPKGAAKKASAEDG